MSEKPLPNYEVVPLRHNNIKVGVIQSRNIHPDPNNPDKIRKKNVDRLCVLIDNAQQHGVRKETLKDLLVFHEYPIAGSDPLWSSKEQHAIAIKLDGPEVEALSRKAKQYNCYIAFGAYTIYEGWEDFYVNSGILINPAGKVILKNWKKRNMPGAAFNTTVFDVLDRFVEMYGWDEIFPVARTDIGNICFTAEIWEPEIVRAFAIKGAEIFIRPMTGGLPEREDVPAQCRMNRMWGIFVNQSMYAAEDRFHDNGSGGSAVFDDMGHLVAEASSNHETLVSATIPLAEYRKTHSVPIIRKELYQKLWEEYQTKYPPNQYLKDGVPKDKVDQIQRLKKIARW
jgi:predicted amidohydrolase